MDADFTARMLATPIRELNLTIESSPLAPIAREFFAELEACGLGRIRPDLYLSTEWGVADGTTAIAIPFYLASPELTALNARKTGHVEGRSPRDILRYLRHEMGHVVNYAYRLYETPEWEGLFGSIHEPYRDDYRPEPFRRDFVCHLPGWYAQKHPDEDWSETFAVWMTPGLDWRAAYADWPVALGKLVYCDEVIRRVAECDPLVLSNERDEDVSEIAMTPGEFYDSLEESADPLPANADSWLLAVFEDLGHPDTPGASPSEPRKLASGLIERLESDLATQIYRWTGHFPERTLTLLRHLADRADQLAQVYPERLESQAIVALTALVGALASSTGRGSV